VTFAELIWENPLLIKHVRSQLRPQQLIPFIVIVVIVCACIIWGVAVCHALKSGVAFSLLLALQGVLVLLGGTSSVASAVAGAKYSGTLDFHRISPQSPVATTLGFILGAPIREWVLMATTLPFSIYAAAVGQPGLDGLVITLLVLIPSALLFHTLAALAGAAAARVRGAGGWVVVLVMILHAGSPSQVGLFTIVPTVSLLLNPKTHLALRQVFFGVELPVAVLSLLHILPFLALLFIAAVRKMKSDAIPVYSKAQAVTFQAVLAAVVLGDAVGLTLPDFSGISATIVIYALTLSAVMLAWIVTPDAGQFAKGIRRARKEGRPAPDLWADRAVNWFPLGWFCGIIIVAGLWSGLPEAVSNGGVHLIAPLLVALGAVVCIGSAKQFFGLEYRKPGMTYLGLFIFLSWVLPVIVGVLLSASEGLLLGSRSQVPQAVTALSPVMGIALAAADKETAAMAAALVSSTLLAIIFTLLSVRAEQKAIRAAAGSASR
jgi:hypothetical protein